MACTGEAAAHHMHTAAFRMSLNRERLLRLLPALGAGSYLVLGTLWIWLSDLLGERLFSTVAGLSAFQTWKGIGFVVASAMVVYLLLTMARTADVVIGSRDLLGDIAASAVRHAAGCRIGVYNNAVNLPEHRRMRLRLWPWLLARYDVDSTYSWWGTVAWRGAMEDPWTAGQGDSGVLLYPPRAGETGPIESVRWELFREGLEDYAYLELARDLADRAAAKLGAPAAARARATLDQALSLVERWPNVKTAGDEPYTLDPRELAAARKGLAESIIALRAALGEG